VSTIPRDLRYTSDHEWVRIEGETATVGITDFAQSQLGEVIYVELPEAGRAFAGHAVLATVESVKAASDVYAPLGVEVTEVNEAVVDDPGLINRSPYGDGWLVKARITDKAGVAKLLAPEAYAAIAVHKE
jgi:glycine cleavage system H protein